MTTLIDLKADLEVSKDLRESAFRWIKLALKFLTRNTKLINS